MLVLLPTFHIFQSTLPRGERHCLKDSVIMTQNFNPRSREGSDGRFIGQIDICKISIHAPARGATFLHLLIQTYRKFQSTLPRGERQQNCTHSQYFFRELCESCQNLQITLTNYSFFYLIICFLQSFSSANQLVFSCSLIIRTN